ncbi:transposase [candidate division CSSED10-310 bacterium]|uniref:Transposase n=1 Tax=candidate division CSSED10-310 bacterium TaxID=2855610 RepID=A0ABV6YWS6_UNCC1
MPQSFSCAPLHVIFSTKKREPFLSDPQLRKEMHAFLGEVSNKLACPSVIVGGTQDHIHLLGRWGKSITPADWVKELKRVSSIWIKAREPRLGSFYWQAGYGIFATSFSGIQSTRDYITGQQEHHRKNSFQDEDRSFLRKHGLEWDERYIWD